MKRLTLHPRSAAGPVTSIHAEITATDNGCLARFRLDGDMERIRIPAPAHGAREDNLWKTTCFEIFWQPMGADAYREFNLSPSTKWAAYDFDDVRANGRDAPTEQVSITCHHDEAGLMLEAEIACKLDLPADIALNAIVEDETGTLQFQALAFPPGAPEFHSPACRTLHLARQN